MRCDAPVLDFEPHHECRDSVTTGPSNMNSSSDIPVDSLELIRNRLQQVHQLLRKLADQIHATNRNPKARLPSYQNLHSQFQVLITQLSSIATQLHANEDILRSTNAYPAASFPTTQHEGLVTTLLRKKPLPEVDSWIDNAIAESSAFKVPVEDDNEFAEWCHSKVKELESEFTFDGFYYEGELEAKAGASEPPETEFKPLAPPMSTEAILRFMTTGALSH